MALLDSFCDLMSQRFYFVMELLGIWKGSQDAVAAGTKEVSREFDGFI